MEDPLAADVRALLERHLAFAHEVTPPEDVHALGVGALLTPDITFFSARRDGVLLGVGALRELDAGHGEIKSMHTAEAARRQGVARAIVEYLIRVARERGYERLSLETGAMDVFQPARALYAGLGFAVCPPFGEYWDSPFSVCMTMDLTSGG